MIYEDAENQDTAGWSVYDADPAGATISNVFDKYRQSQVIELTGTGTQNGYKLGTNNGSDWHNTNQTIIQWSMNYAEYFQVFVKVQTNGRVPDTFTTHPANTSSLGTGTYVHHGLGTYRKRRAMAHHYQGPAGRPRRCPAGEYHPGSQWLLYQRQWPG